MVVSNDFMCVVFMDKKMDNIFITLGFRLRFDSRFC